MSVRPAAQSVIGRQVIAPWQVRRCRGLWLPEDEYVIRDASDRVSFVNSLVPKPRRTAIEQATATDAPFWVASMAAFGARPVLDTATSRWMQADAMAADFSGAAGPAPFTAFFVNNWSGTALNRTIFTLGANATQPYFFFQRRLTDGFADVQAVGDVTGLGRATGDALPETAAVFEMFWTGSAVTVLRNGASVGIDSVAMTVGASTFTRLTFGALRRGTVARPLGRNIGGAALYLGALSAAERRIVRTYFLRRFSL